jgi:hypothetical protein
MEEAEASFYQNNSVKPEEDSENKKSNASFESSTSL